jgi:hypothetical protein
VSCFPNFFILLGPNTGLGHNSVVLMIEAQVRYVMSCLHLMQKRGQGVMDVRPASQRKFVEEIRRRLPGTVWESGCRSWYQMSATARVPRSGRARWWRTREGRAAFRREIMISAVRGQTARLAELRFAAYGSSGHTHMVNSDV